METEKEITCLVKILDGMTGLVGLYTQILDENPEVKNILRRMNPELTQDITMKTESVNKLVAKYRQEKGWT
jgi:hypothetical protein